MSKFVALLAAVLALHVQAEPCEEVVAMVCENFGTSNLLDKLECLVANNEKIGQLCTNSVLTGTFKQTFEDSCSTQLLASTDCLKDKKFPEDAEQTARFLECFAKKSSKPSSQEEDEDKTCTVDKEMLEHRHRPCPPPDHHHPHPPHHGGGGGGKGEEDDEEDDEERSPRHGGEDDDEEEDDERAPHHGGGGEEDDDEEGPSDHKRFPPPPPKDGDKGKKPRPPPNHDDDDKGRKPRPPPNGDDDEDDKGRKPRPPPNGDDDDDDKGRKPRPPPKDDKGKKPRPPPHGGKPSDDEDSLSSADDEGMQQYFKSAEEDENAIGFWEFLRAVVNYPTTGVRPPCKLPWEDTVNLPVCVFRPPPSHRRRLLEGLVALVLAVFLTKMAVRVYKRGGHKKLFCCKKKGTEVDDLSESNVSAEPILATGQYEQLKTDPENKV